MRPCLGTCLADGMAMRVRLLFISPVLAMLMAGCSGNPTSPSVPDDYSTVSRFIDSDTNPPLSIGCQEELEGYQCWARMMSGEDSQTDVTDDATWLTSDTRIATVNSRGFVVVLKPGEVAVRAKYQGLTGTAIMRVQPGGLQRYYRALSGFVRDAETQAKLGGVAVKIVNGPNTGRTTTTHDDGAYQLYDLEIGTFTVRFTKPGYATAERQFFLPGDRYNGLDITLNK
jgi:hypothetical protein